jgi:putative PIN family toxin of toxin-antitoxin system
MTRVVFDTNILYSGILKRTGNEARAFDLVTENFVIPCVSPDVLAEYNAVLYRPGLRQHRERVAEILRLFAAIAVHVTPEERLIISDDERDNRIYECAAASQADFIVTGNTRHFSKDYKTQKS